jgi:DNA-directed RNA polymerase sigma subunit (sigma70/sigma32)
LLFACRVGMNKDHTLQEVGQQFSVTRERINAPRCWWF